MDTHLAGKHPREDDLGLIGRLEVFGRLMRTSTVTGRGGCVLDLEEGVEATLDLMDAARDTGSAVYIVGNGGSASIASHMANDFVNVGGLRCFTIHDSSILTCMANDYGYEQVYARQLQTLARPGDVLIAISSSGSSRNIRAASDAARSQGASVVTLSGFSAENPLRSQGDVNFWISSTDYGIVEIGHLFILHNLADRMRVARRAATSFTEADRVPAAT